MIIVILFLYVNFKKFVNSISLTFSDSQINNLLAEYLELKEDNTDTVSPDISVDYDTIINDLIINIDMMK